MAAVIILPLLLLSCCVCAPAFGEDYGHTARGIFMMLPPGVFESTPEGLTDTEKRELLANGRSEYWEITGESPDVLVFTALPFRDSSIGLRLFRNDRNGSVEAAIGTLGEPVCTLELWRLDASGRLVPIDTPAEPEADEFFSKKGRIPKHINKSVLICLGSGGLEARPIFWNERGMLPARADNAIKFIWTGDKFKKVIGSAD